MDTEALKKSLLKKFQEVTADRLQKIQLGVLDLEKETAAQAAEDVARELHTMKGEARMLGLAAVGQLAHACEDLLKANREGRAATSVATDLLLQACDALSDLIEDIPGAQAGSGASAAICQALAAASGAPIPPLNPRRAPSGPKVPPKSVAPPPTPAPEPERPSLASAPVSPSSTQNAADAS